MKFSDRPLCPLEPEDFELFPELRQSDEYRYWEFARAKFRLKLSILRAVQTFKKLFVSTFKKG